MIFNFNLKKAAIFQAVRWERYWIFRYTSVFKKIFFTFFIIFFLIFLCGFWSEKSFTKRILGLSLILLVFDRFLIQL